MICDIETVSDFHPEEALAVLFITLLAVFRPIFWNKCLLLHNVIFRESWTRTVAVL